MVDFNAEVAGTGLSEAARALGAEPSPRALSARLREMRKAIGLPESLAAAGVKREHLGPLADGAIEDACHRSNPRPCTRSDLLALYEASM